MSSLDFTIVAAYLLGILGLGVEVSRRIGTFRDFFVAGGRMGTPLLVCTLVSTYYGLDVLFGASEVSYREGLVSWFVYLRPYYLAILIAAFFLARRLRRYDFLSLPDVVGHFYGRWTQAVIAVASFVYALPILAIMGIGIVLDVTLGIPFAWGVLLGAGVSAAYTILGGLLADALTDTLQFVLMCLTLGIAAALVFSGMGGVETLGQRLEPRFFEPWGTYPTGVLLVFGGSALSALVEPAFYQRIFAAVSYRAILVALLLGVVLWAAFDWVVTLLGMAAAATDLEVEPRYALLTLVLGVLPAGLKGLFLAGVLATAMSTIDSYLLIAGGNIAYDLYRPFSRRPLSDADLIRLTRWMLLLSTAVTVIFALFFRTMVSAWVFMSTVLIAAALVPVIGGLYFPHRATPAAGLASGAVGLIVSVLYYVLVHALGRFDAELATQVWEVKLGGGTVRLWQEYALLFALPASVVAYLVGAAVGGRRRC